jgi:hypothetical protein
MDLPSLLIGITIGLCISTGFYLYVLFKFRQRQFEENLKNFTELRELISKMEVAPDGNKEE